MATVSSADVSGIARSLADLSLRSFGRQQETKADHFGLELIHAEYQHIDQAWRLFQRLVETGEEIPDSLSYLSTHQSSNDRKAALIHQAKQNRWAITGKPIKLA